MLILYSPIPPADTGTAPYLAALLAELSDRLGSAAARASIVLAVDSEQTGQPTVGVQDTPLAHDGWTVRDHRLVQRGAEDVCVYFLASNPFHHFVYEALAAHGPGRCVSVLHDLTVGFMLSQLAKLPGSGYAGLLETAFGSLNGLEAGLARDFDLLDSTASYFCDAQGVTIERSDLIITHSSYARSRLIFGHPDPDLAERIVVCQHPPPALELTAAAVAQRQARADLLTVGSFGYVTTAKRIPSIVSAWNSFFLGYRGALRPRLNLGGRFDPTEKGSLLAGCDAQVRTTIGFVGHLAEPDLYQAIADSDLLVTLRFPSCGETSGIVAIAQAVGAPLAVSDFGAFREEAAAYRISVDPLDEDDDLLAAFQASAEAKEAGSRAVNLPPAGGLRHRQSLADRLAQFVAPVLSTARP